jgi:hypothetical protein
MPEVKQTGAIQQNPTLQNESRIIADRDGEIHADQGVTSGPTKTQIYNSPNKTDGQVVVYGQIHNRPESSIDTLIATGERQAEILQKMLKDKLLHHFVEGQDIDFTPEQKKGLIAGTNRDIEIIFPDGLKLGDLTPRQKIFIAQHGAAEIYQALVPAATLHKTISTEDNENFKKEYKAKMADPKATDEELAKLSKDFREKCAGKEIAKFMKNHPGEKVGMEFGENHKWEPEDFPDPKHAPSIHLYKWSKYVSPAQSGGEMYLATDPAEKAKIIKEAKGIEDKYLFGAADENQAIDAYRKIVVDMRDYNNKEQFKEGILEQCKKRNWSKLEAEINKGYESNSPPFNKFDIDANAIDEFKALPKDEFQTIAQGDAISQQTHIPTQNYMAYLADKIDPFVLKDIYDTTGQIFALKKLDLSTFEENVKSGKITKEEAVRLIKGTMDFALPPDDPLYLSAISPYQRQKYEFLHKEFDRMFKEKEGPFAFLK